jgi:hypothetical protein
MRNLESGFMFVVGIAVSQQKYAVKHRSTVLYVVPVRDNSYPILDERHFLHVHCVTCSLEMPGRTLQRESAGPTDVPLSAARGPTWDRSAKFA